MHVPKDSKANPIIIRPDTLIGNNAAEADDEFLFRCFVDHPSLSTIADTNASQMFLSGRTGTGKTAIMRMIESKHQHSTAMDLADMAMNYVANSDIIRFLDAIGADLDLFFQTLWKHVLCIEFIRLRFNVSSERDSNNIFARLADFVGRDKRKERALHYLKEWESKFWITMDENIKEITSKLETGVTAEFGAEIEKFTGNAGYARTLSTEKRANYTARAKKIVQADQLSELSKVLELMSSYDQGREAGPYYILIDKIDERWVDETIRFELIRALIECLKSFRKIHNLKIIVSMRPDVLERVVQVTNHPGYQRDKYDDYFLRLTWEKEQLKELIEKRINFLYRFKYNSNHVNFNDIFPNKIGSKEPLDYMLERTLYRPRDLISFVNRCLIKAQNSTEVSAKNIRNAEAEYSQIRLQALYEEWNSAIPSVEQALQFFAKFGERFAISDLSTKETLEDLIVDVTTREHPETDPLVIAAAKYVGDMTTNNLLDVVKVSAAELYRIGAIGLKTNSHDRYQYSFHDAPVISKDLISPATKIHIHPMLHRALNVSPRETRHNST